MKAHYHPVDDEEGPLGSFFQIERVPGGCIWLKDKPRVSTVTHECLHAAFHTMRVLGVTLAPESEETFCYLQDFLVEGILRKVRGR